MRVSVSWLRELVDLDGVETSEIAQRLTKAGLQVEKIDDLAGELTGPIVVGKVVSFTEEKQKNGKTIRWCVVDVGDELNVSDANPEITDGRGIICGALNFREGDFVVVSLPGAVLPGGFEISSRKTYGHFSDGMICAADELGIGEDHSGIMILPPQVDGRDLILGEDALGVLGLKDEVLEIDVTPDMGYCLSMRGIARETAQAFGVKFNDPFDIDLPDACADGFPVSLETDKCSNFVALTVRGVNREAQSPQWMVSRLRAAGIRSISLPVDITNYVMIETGQPLHGYDLDRLCGRIVVRQAKAGETLVTLDDTQRTLADEDILITDESGPIGLAGVMGGMTTELTESTANVLIEAAHFDSVSISRTFRRHKLPSESSKRFERGVDPQVTFAAARRAAQLFEQLAGATFAADEVTVAGGEPGGAMASRQIAIDEDLPSRILGCEVSADEVVAIFTASGMRVSRQDGRLTIIPPSWRHDLVDPYDYVEEVGRKIGFDRIPSTLPVAPAGRGLTKPQRLRRSVLRALADAGFVEVITLPFLGEAELNQCQLGETDLRRRVVALANPLSDAQPFLRTTLLPGLFAAVTRNTSRSQSDLSLMECGLVFHARDHRAAPVPGVQNRPTEAELAQIEAALPEQPRMLSAVLCGNWRPADWRGPAFPVDWTHAVMFAETVAEVSGVELTRRAAAIEPWHPGRCAELLVGESVVGVAGELHPQVCKSFGLPARTCAVELNLDLIIEMAPDNGEIRSLSPFPMTKEDVALVVDADTPAESVAQALREGCGSLLETVSLFDVYESDQLGAGKKSLAFSLGFRASDRTLEEAEAMAALDQGVALAAERFGATRRA